MFNVVHIKSALYKALFVSIVYIVAYMFYNTNFIREHIEDIAFDVVSKFSIKTTAVKTDSSKVMLFAIDDIYMKEHQLYNEENRSNFGYLFPRDHIAEFIENLDDLTMEIESKNLPKALFIDYDMSFTTMPYGKELSKEDKKLLKVLKRKRAYTIFLPKTNSYNFIENSKDMEIQKLIQNKKIVFVSVSFLESSDAVVRRYESSKKYKDDNFSKEYEGVWIALWQTLEGKEIDLNSSKELFLKDDIVGNRIMTKSYYSFVLEDGCSMQGSYWQNLTKYSANCSLFDVIEEDYAGSILMLGGTYSQNNDNFDINNILSTDSFSGVDIHANTLMTLLYLDGPLKRLSLWVSLMLVFFTFFFLSLFISWLFLLVKIENKEKEFILLIFINTIIFVSISIYLLNVQHLWFNWFIPWAALGLVEFFYMIEPWVLKNINKWRNNE